MSARPLLACLSAVLLPSIVWAAADSGTASASGTRGAPAGSVTPRSGGLSAAVLRNFSGMWMLGEAPIIRPATLKPEMAERYAGAGIDGPAAGPGVADSARQCVPSPLFGAAGGYPLRIAQTPTQLAVLSEENSRVHRIFLDRDFPEKLTPSYAGTTIGHWEGSTLVAETRGLRFAANVPVLPDYRVIERLRRGADGLTLEQEVSIESSAYATPARRTYRYYARPDLHWQGAVCEEQPGPLPAAPPVPAAAAAPVASPAARPARGTL